MWQLFLHLPDGYLVGMGAWLLCLAACPFLMLRLRRGFRPDSRWRRLIPPVLSLWMMLALLTGIELGYALLYDTTDALDVTNVSHRWFEVHVGDDLKLLSFSENGGIYYRDDVEFPTTPDERTHVCFIGDSFTFGHGVPNVADRFTNQLRIRLDSNRGPEQTAGRFVVSNLSKPGTDLYWTDTIIRNITVNDWGVDHVVYVFCLNDIDSCDPGFAQRSSDLADLRHPPDSFLVRDTYFLNWLYFRTQLLASPEVKDYYGYVREFYDGAAWGRFVALLQGVREVCRERDVDFTIVVFPFLHNLGPDYPFREIHAQIRRGCDDLQIRCVDLEPALNQHSDETLTVNPFDAHPNELAHSIVADALLKQLILQDSTVAVSGDDVTATNQPSLERVSGD
ncbi:MAG: SGNH/GDSL hydrolase family protein [Planctomycetota bacterium]|jgi:hypothetical protein